MDAPHTGEVTLRLGGRDCTLVYDWRALSTLSREVGMSSLENIGADPDGLLKVLLIGLRRHHPDLTQEAVEAAAPPYMHVLTCVMRALAYAMHGPDLPEGNALAGAAPPLATS